MIIPSMINKGELSKAKELKPLKTIWLLAPAKPEVGLIVKPATRPCKLLTKSFLCVSAKSWPFSF